MKETVINKKITYAVVAILLIVLVTIGATYAYFSAQASTGVQTVTTGTLTMNFTNGQIVRATGITPIKDSEIKTKATELPFTVTNTGNKHMKLTIKLTDITIDDALKDVDFRWGLYNADTDKGVSFGIFKYSETGKEEILLRDVILDSSSATKNYKLRIWIHDNNELQNEMQGKTFSGKVTVYGEAIEYTPETCFTMDGTKLTAYDATTCGTDVVIPKTVGGQQVNTIAPQAFSKQGLTSVIIPDTVGYIMYNAFEYNQLTHVTIPESVKQFGKTVFETNPITTVTLTENLTTVDERVFNANSLQVVVVPEPIATSYSYIFPNNPLTDLSVMGDEYNNVETIYISTADELIDIQQNTANYKNKKVVLKNNIDLNGIAWTPIEATYGALNNFTLDGDGHSILNMNVTGVDFGGFIAHNASDITIKDITFDNAKVVTNTGNQKYAGVLIGHNTSFVNIDKVNVINSRVENTWQSGGMVGYSSEALTFKNSKVEKTLVGGPNATSGSFFGLGRVNVTIENCIANDVDLYTDSLTWETTAKKEGNFFVGHLYTYTLTLTNSTETDVNVVSSY